MALLVPAILSSKRADFQTKLNRLVPHCQRIQIDIMDGKFVDHQTITPQDLPPQPSDVTFELHLMVADPASIISQISKANVSTIIFHYESTKSPADIINLIPPEFGKGIAINPGTPIEKILPYLGGLDLVLVMSVEPGEAGQKFIPSALLKISALHNLKPDLIIEVDGGINLQNAKQVVDAGADQIVVGSGIFKAKNLSETIHKLKSVIE